LYLEVERVSTPVVVMSIGERAGHGTAKPEAWMAETTI
jgi:hypothetical protein